MEKEKIYAMEEASQVQGQGQGQEQGQGQGQGQGSIAESAASTIIDYGKLLLQPVFPVSGDCELDFDTLDCVPLGEVNIIDDEEYGNNAAVIELSGQDSRITFYAPSNYQYLVCYLNSCGRYVSLTLNMINSEGKEVNIEMSNRRSTVLIDKNSAKIPLNVGAGWQRMCVDLNDMVYRCFGSKFASCTDISIAGGPRLAKLFFQGHPYHDPQLPPFLRVLVV
jgi:hypothetical protein